jgi:hypothetical protein
MRRSRTYYDLFDVPQGATLREIRAAYIQLMKRHHPDKGGSDEAASDVVATANLYYAVLKDPRKRAAYDDQIARAAIRPTPERRRESKPARNWTRAVLVLAVAAALTVFAGSALRTIGDGARATAGPDFFAPDDVSQTMMVGVAMPTSDEVGRIVRKAISTTAADAAWTSRQCYDGARAERSETSAQTCIIFDEAALYSPSVWRDGLAGSTYFNPDLVRLRQSGALAPFERDSGRRLDRLRTMAFVQVLREARAEKVDGGPIAPAFGQ